MPHTNAPPLRAALLGISAVLGLTVLLGALATSDLTLIPFDTVRIDTSSGPMHVTRHNPLGILAVATLAALVIAFLAAGAARLWPLIDEMMNRASREALRGELDSVAEVYGKLIEVNGAYADTLRRFNVSLEGQTQAAPLEGILRDLIGEHQRMREETRNLTDELKSKQVEKQAVEAQLSQVEAEGRSDPLTGVGNRRIFDQELRAAIVASHEAGTSLALVMADIDHFKRINDAYGHQVGDEVIKLLAKIISRAVGDSDIAARYGGEEFGIIMPGADLGDAKSVAERIRKDLAGQKVLLRETGQNIGTVTASFGVATLLTDDDAEALLRRADGKLYAAKSAGRNRVLA